MQGHLGLQVQPQFVAFHRTAQFREQRQILGAARINRSVVAQRSAELALGGIHGDFGAAEQHVGVFCIAGPASDADTGAQVHGLVLQGQGLLKRGQDLLGHRQRPRSFSAPQQHGKFIAPQARHHIVGRRHQVSHPLRHGLQQTVAKGVTHHVVHMLEAVQIQRQHAHRRSLACARLQGPHQGFAKALAVGQACQPVPIGQPHDFLLLCADVHAHAVERTRQLANFVLPAGVLHGGVVLTPRQALGGAHEGLQRGDHALGHQPTAQRKEQNAASGNDCQQQLQLTIGRHHRAHRPQQQCLHLAIDTGQRAGA